MVPFAASSVTSPAPSRTSTRQSVGIHNSRPPTTIVVQPGTTWATVLPPSPISTRRCDRSPGSPTRTAIARPCAPKWATSPALPPIARERSRSAPNNANAHLRRGMVLQKRKDMPAAIAEYDHALRIDARLFTAYVLRGNARYHCGDWRGLCADYKAAFALQPDRSAAVVVRTLLPQPADGDVRAALIDCEEHLQRDAHDPISRARRGLLLLYCGRADEARAELAQCQARYSEAAPYLELIVTHIKRIAAAEVRS